MTILNLMLGRQSGGLEQAAVDYAEALRLAGFEALTVTAPGAWVHTPLAAAEAPFTPLPQLGAWDPVAAIRLRRLALRAEATAIICHGNRALSIATRAFPSGQRISGSSGQRPKIIAVAHNYLTKRFPAADACFCITEHARRQLMASGIASERLFFMPNMVRLGQFGQQAEPAMSCDSKRCERDEPASQPRDMAISGKIAGRKPKIPTIGSMGRFVAKKGFDVYLDALAILKARGVAFRAVLGGGGELESALHEKLHTLALTDHCSMPGWIADKSAFFAGLDVFVLPSRHEPFGIVLIEAMAHGVPVIAAAAEGPREIIRQGENGILVPIDDAQALADALQTLLADPALAQRLRAQAAADVRRHYSMEAMAGRLQSALAAIHG